MTMTIKEIKANERIAKKDRNIIEGNARKIIKLLKRFNKNNFVIEDGISTDLIITPMNKKEKKVFDEIIKLMNFKSHNVLGSVVVEVESKLEICEFSNSRLYEYSEPNHLYFRLWKSSNVEDFLKKIS